MFPKRPFALSNRLKTTPFQKQPRRRGSSSSENWQPEIAPRRGRGPSPVRRCSSGSARASSAAPPEQSPARRDRGQRQRRVKRPASRPASENVPRLGRVQLACQCHRDGLKLIKAHSGLRTRVRTRVYAQRQRQRGCEEDLHQLRNEYESPGGRRPAGTRAAHRAARRPARVGRRAIHTRL